MIVWVLTASGVVLLATVALSSRLARSTAVRAAEQEALNAADAARNRVLMVLGSVERSTDLLGASVAMLHPQGRSLDELLRRSAGFEAVLEMGHQLAGYVHLFAPPESRLADDRRDRLGDLRRQLGVGKHSSPIEACVESAAQCVPEPRVAHSMPERCVRLAHRSPPAGAGQPCGATPSDASASNSACHCFVSAASFFSPFDVSR